MTMVNSGLKGLKPLDRGSETVCQPTKFSNRRGWGVTLSPLATLLMAPDIFHTAYHGYHGYMALLVAFFISIFSLRGSPALRRRQQPTAKLPSYL